MIASFSIGAKPYSVRKSYDPDSEHIGEVNADQLEIEINALYPETVQEQAFYHELTHCILFEMGEDELAENERFVQSFSLLLHQAINTLKTD